MRKQMKNILLAGACAAMVCSAVCGVSAWQAPVAQADEATPVLEIGRKNLLLEDNIQIMFQVKTDNAIVSDSDVKLLVWTQPQEAYTYGTQNTVIGYNANKTFEEEPYYVYTELAIKQMTDDVYVCAYANVDGTEYYSAPAKYSILEYACNKLDKTEAEPTQDEDLKVLLGKMLDFGAAMQTLKKYKDDRLANADYVYVRLAEGDTFADGFNYGLFQEDEKVAVYGDLSHAMYEELLVTEDGVAKLVVPAEKLIIEDKEEPEVPEEPKYPEVAKNYVMADYAAGTQFANNEEHVLDEYVTITTTQCWFTEEAIRLYVSTTHDGNVVVSAKNLISSFAMNVGGNAGTLNIFGSENGSDWEPITTATVTKNYDVIEVSYFGAYKYLKLDAEAEDPIDIKEFTFTFVSTDEKNPVKEDTTKEKNAIKAQVASEVYVLANNSLMGAGYLELLPNTAKNGAKITWEIVSDAGVNVSLNGNVLTVAENPAQDTTITLQATFTCGEAEEDKASASKEIQIQLMHKKEETQLVEKEATISFADKAQRTSYTTSQQVWEQNGIKLVNDKASSTTNVGDYANPARFYAKSKITITCGAFIKKIEITSSEGKYATPFEGFENATVTVSGTKVTVVFDTPVESAVISSLSAQARIQTMKVTYLG